MKKLSTKKLVINALMIALVFVTTRFTSIPGPVGYFNIGDAAIIVAASLLGRNSGFIAGSIGSCLADIATGYWIFAPITFVVKGLEGFVVGAVIKNVHKGKSSELIRIAAVVAGAAVMIAGYFIAEMYILRIFDSSFGYAAAVKDGGFNIIQGAVSAIVGYALSALLNKAKLADRIAGN